MGQILVFVLLKIKKTFEDQGLITEVKKLSALINDWENDMHMGSIQAT